MNINQEKSGTGSFHFFLHPNIWLLLFALEIIPTSVTFQYVEDAVLPEAVPDNEINENHLNKSESFNGQNLSAPYFNVVYPTPSKNNDSCKYVESDDRLTCTGFLDVSFLRKFQHKKINNLVIERYETESELNQNYLNGTSLETGEWYMNLPKIFQKLTAEIRLVGTGVIMNVIIGLEPNKNKWDSYYVYGITFSNSVIKFSNNLIGRVNLAFENNRTVVYVSTQTVGGETPLTVLNSLRFIQRDLLSDVDEWKAEGIVKSQYIAENHLGFFKGTVKTLLLQGECRFAGEIEWDSSNLRGTIYGSVSSVEDKKVTIPRGVFANMTIKKLAFKDSNFLNDFEEDTFEGLKGVEVIAFINSELKIMPKLSEFFRHLPDLQEIYIEGCTTPNLKFGTLSDLKNVRKISLKNSGPFKFKELSFCWLKNSNLTHLSLMGSHVIIPSTAHSVLDDVSDTLKFFDVSHSTVEEKELTVLVTSLKIETLIADNLQLTKIPTTSLAQVKDTLQYLSLKGNHFKKSLEKNMFTSVLGFPRMEKLKKLNLENCFINYVERGAFDNLPNLKILKMKFNQLENLQDGWVFSSPLITHLDLSSNGLYPKFPHVVNYEKETKLNLTIFKNLKVLDLSNGDFMDIKKVIGSLGSSLRVLYMRNVELENLPSNIFEKLTNLNTLDLSFNINLLSSFSIDLFEGLKNLKNLMLNNCRINSDSVNFLKKPEMFGPGLIQLENLTYLDLSKNNIRTFDFLKGNKFPNLKILNLSGNGIITWKTSLFEYVKHLETLFLDENKIENMTEEMIDDLWKLKNVKLGNNPFICKPFVYEILKMANKSRTAGRNMENFLLNFNAVNKSSADSSASSNSNHSIKMVNILDWSDHAYACFSCNQSKYIPFVHVNETCDDQLSHQKNVVKEIVVLWIPMTVFVGIVLTVFLLCKKFLGVHFMSNAVKHAVALTFLNMGEKEPVKYNYNVFVSYSDGDRQWVVDNLLPRLETFGNIKVCLHERDFQVGLSILENIIACMDSSKNIILVLSQNFLKSHWCQYEMHLAQHRLLEKGRDQLLLIFLENIPAIKKTKTLRYLMMTKTYLEWPANSKNSNDFEMFWSRLLKSLSLKTDEN